MYQEVDAPTSTGTDAPTLQTLPCVSLHLTVHLCPLSYPLLVHVSVSLNPVSYSSKLIEPKQGVVGTSHLQLAGQKYRRQPGVVTGV